jgi:predicted AlkP superfamily phosphohydrolase/phosphomutase
MMKNGALPNFLRLKEIGSYRRLATTNPPHSPVAWAAFATGRNPGKNGIFDFIVRDPRRYCLSLSFSKMKGGKPTRAIKGKTFWQYLSEGGIPAVVLSCPVTFPPDKICGRILSGMGVPDVAGTEGTFMFYTTDDVVKNSSIGGRISKVKKAHMMILNLYGPKIARGGGQPEYLRNPARVTFGKDDDTVLVEHRNKKVELKKGCWSDWQETIFRLGWLRKIKAIFKFYLIDTHPHFKLYISPMNFDPRSPFFGISWPRRYAKELADNIGLYHTQGMPMNTWAVNENILDEDAFLAQAEEILRQKRAIFEFEFKRLKNGVLFAYFEPPDTIQHMFWRYIDPDSPLHEKDLAGRYRQTIEDWYKRMDEILGDVMRALSENDSLIVLSDHGFGPFRRAVHINSWLRQNGYLEFKNPAAESGSELLKDINWAKTRAYAIGFGAIYINQKRREVAGIVKPGDEAQALKDEISLKLKRWTDTKDNKPIVYDIYKNEDIFKGEYSKEAPDLYMGFNPGYRASWQTALGATPAELVEDNLKKWSGDHLFDPHFIPGIIFSN